MNDQQINEYIVRRHDELPANRWCKAIAEELAEQGVTITRNGVRCRYDRHMASLQATQEESELTHEERVAIAKEKLLKQQKERASNQDAVDQARTELLMDTLREAITPLDFTYTPFSREMGSGDEESVCLILSDTHFGKKTTSYNMGIAMDRFVHLVDGLLSIVELHRKAYPIKHLHIFWTGDIVDGSSIYPTHAHHVDGHMVNQIFGVMPMIVEQLARLATEFETVSNHCIRGNHGRVGKQDHEETNWDNIVYKTLELATVNIPNVSWDIPLGWQHVVDVMGTKILQYHGHQIKMTMNIPWYGITTRVARWAISEKIGHFDVAVQGHFHTSSSFMWSSKKLFTNGTTGSGDDFALEFIGLESSETQWLFGIHPKRGVTWQYELDFK